MGQQIGFYAAEKDNTALLELTESLGLLAIPEIVNFDPEEVDIKAVKPTKFCIPEDQYYFYLLPDTYSVVEAFYKNLHSHTSLWKLMDDASPVIQFKPSSSEDNKLGNGRFYLNTDPDDPRYPVIRGKYKSLVNYLGKWIKTDQFGFYVGPYTAQLVREGCIHLKHLHHELKIV
jgi:hypothetical protein